MAVTDTPKRGYYTEDDTVNVWTYFMGAEPPEEQFIYIFRRGQSKLLDDGF